MNHALLAISSVAAAVTLLTLATSCGGSGGGGGNGGPGAGSGEAPHVRSARYLDEAPHGDLGPGDRVVVAFDRPIVLEGATAEHFALAVQGDTFGTGAAVVSGPGAGEVTIVLGAGAVLRARGEFRAGDVEPHAPTGVDVTAGLPARAIRAAQGDRTAVPSAFADLASGFVAGEPFAGSGSGAATVETRVLRADVNGDGDPDLIVWQGDGSPLGVWRHEGGGTFRDTGATIGSAATSAVAAADVDRDGDVDLLTGSRTGSGEPNRVWHNAGDGTFQPSDAFGVEGARAFVLGDLDGDGDLDLIEGTDERQPNRVWRNDRGTFTDTFQSLGTAATHGLLLADLDRDGDLDLVQAARDATRVWRNDGGAFRDAQQTLASGAARSLQAFDLDGDGDLDLIVAGGVESRLWRNDGNGGLAPAGTIQGADPNDTVAAAAALDLDGDGRPELVAATLGEQSPDVVLAVTVDAAGNFELQPTAMALDEASTQDVVLDDFDGDGDADVLTISEAGALVLWRGSLSASRGVLRFDAGETVGRGGGAGGGIGNVRAAALADFDRDGDPDLLLGRDAPAASELWLNDGDGRFAVQRQSFATARTQALAVGDLDGDGDLDFVAGNAGAPTQVWRNDGLGAFTIGTVLPLATTRALALGDLDGDGDLDLVRGNGSGEPSTVSWNDGRGAFVDSGQSLTVANDVHAVALGDLDGDGDLDLVLGAADGPDRVLRNDGSGRMEPAAQLLGAGGTRALLLVDLDRDGRLDLVSGKLGAPSLLFQGLGGGEFLRWRQELGADVVALAAADADGDGDLDLLAGVAGGDNVLWRNDGTAAFVLLDAALPVAAAGAVAFGDLDRDGDLDLVVTDAAIAGRSVLFRQH